MAKREREELLGIADRKRGLLAARVRLLERNLRDCLSHINLLEGCLPMANAEDESLYKDSILFGERVSACLPNAEPTRPASEPVPATGGDGLGSGDFVGQTESQETQS